MKTIPRVFQTRLKLVDIQNTLADMISHIQPSYYHNARWFQSKNAAIERFEIYDAVKVKNNEPGLQIFFIIVRFYLHETGDDNQRFQQYYFMPLLVTESKNQNRFNENPVLEIQACDGSAWVFDGVKHVYYARMVELLIDSQAKLPGEKGVFEFYQLKKETVFQINEEDSSFSNSITVVRKDELLKTYRRLEMGVNPELELGRFFQNCPDMGVIPIQRGYAVYREYTDNEMTILILQEYVENTGNIWDYLLNQVRTFYEYIAEQRDIKAEDFLNSNRLSNRLKSHYHPLCREINQLGQSVSRLHQLLAEGEASTFQPEPISNYDLKIWVEKVLFSYRRFLSGLSGYAGDYREKIGWLVNNRQFYEEILTGLPEKINNPGFKIRIHGDLHLGQILKSRDGFVFIDFEGEPLKTIAERREKFSPLKDVAGMLRSFHYVVNTAFFEYMENSSSKNSGALEKEKEKQLKTWVKTWKEISTRQFLQGYFTSYAEAGAGFLPVSTEETELLLGLFKLDKAFYELDYELNNRPNWLPIPLEGLRECLDQLDNCRKHRGNRDLSCRLGFGGCEGYNKLS